MQTNIEQYIGISEFPFNVKVAIDTDPAVMMEATRNIAAVSPRLKQGVLATNSCNTPSRSV